MTDTRRWLEAIGLAQYAHVFGEHAISLAMLPRLTDSDLRTIGVAALGHRLRILDAASEIAGGPPDSRRSQPTARAHPLPRERAPAEHRLVTVMFCDLVESTMLAHGMDGERWRETVASFQRAVRTDATAYGGYVAQFVGDGAMVLFGYPVAHEDDAERAIRTALRSVASIGSLRRDTGVPIRLRVGVATGPVIAGDLDASGVIQTDAAVGAATHLAARLQSLAAAGSVVICPTTHSLVGGLFELVPLGSHRLKGFPEPISAWQAVAAAGVASRYRVRRPGGLSPMEGRDAELGHLLRHWSDAERGVGRTVVIRAEAGLGKSRLVAAVQEAVRDRASGVVQFSCSPHDSETPLHPFMVALTCPDGSAPPDAVGNDRHDAAAPGVVTAPVTAAEKRARMFDAVERWLRHRCDAGPVIAVFEDAHWADPSSRELLGRIALRVHAMPMLLLVTSRAPLGSPLDADGGFEVIELGRLENAHAARLVASVAGERAISERWITQIVERADGVPLFLEELARSVVASPASRIRGPATADASPLPVSLQAALVAHLDRVPLGRKLAQVAAAIGREFESDLVAAASGLAADEVDVALAQLLDARLVEQAAEDDGTTFRFRHALIRDAAYETLLSGARSDIHARIADAMRRLRPTWVTTRPELLALHLARAGQVAAAVDAYAGAAHVALSRSAAREAEAHARNALTQLARMPEGPARDRLEQPLRALLATALAIGDGYTGSAVVAALERAVELARRERMDEALEQALSGLGVARYTRGEYRHSLPIAYEALRVAERLENPLAQASAHRLVAASSNPVALYDDALAHARRAITLYDAAEPDSPAWTRLHDVSVSSYCQLAIALWHRGKLRQSAAADATALEQALRTNHPGTICMAILFAQIFSAYRQRDFPALGRGAERMLSIAQQMHSVQWETYATAALGCSGIAAGHARAGLADLDRAIATAARHAMGVFLPTMHLMRAEGLALMGEHAVAQAITAHALTLAQRRQEYWCLPEIWRLRARFFAAGPAALASNRLAVESARRQGSIPYELRALADRVGLLGGNAGAPESECRSGLLDRARSGGADAAVIQAIVSLGSQDGRAAAGFADLP